MPVIQEYIPGGPPAGGDSEPKSPWDSYVGSLPDGHPLKSLVQNVQQLEAARALHAQNLQPRLTDLTQAQLLAASHRNLVPGQMGTDLGPIEATRQYIGQQQALASQGDVPQMAQDTYTQNHAPDSQIAAQHAPNQLWAMLSTANSPSARINILKQMMGSR